MLNPIKWIKGWESETKKLWLVSLILATWALSKNGMLNPLGEWSIGDVLFYPLTVILVGAALILPVALILELLEGLLYWMRKGKDKD